MMPYEPDDLDRLDGPDEEPVGSCEDCDVNIYEFDVVMIGGIAYCNSCAYYHTAAARLERKTPTGE